MTPYKCNFKGCNKSFHDSFVGREHERRHYYVEEKECQKLILSYFTVEEFADAYLQIENNRCSYTGKSKYWKGEGWYVHIWTSFSSQLTFKYIDDYMSELTNTFKTIYKLSNGLREFRELRPKL